jgi:hypothetical protein
MAYNSGAAGAFTPIGNTVTFLANTAAPAAVQANHNYATFPSYCQYRIFNSGSNLIFLGYGASATIANNNATVVSSTANCIPVLPGTLEIVSLPSNTYLTAITSSGNSQVYVTPGNGV